MKSLAKWSEIEEPIQERKNDNDKFGQAWKRDLEMWEIKKIRSFIHEFGVSEDDVIKVMNKARRFITKNGTNVNYVFTEKKFNNILNG